MSEDAGLDTGEMIIQVVTGRNRWRLAWDWYARFFRLRETAFRDERSFFRKYADLSEAEALDVAQRLWPGINLRNLRENILPTRHRASLVLTKGPSHRVESVKLRRL